MPLAHNMVNIVLVSHSAKVAAGVKELAEQMTHGRVKIFAAGGLDSETLGTNVETILQALTAADNPDGTLVLMDLGSAILSAETALEVLPPEMHPRVRFCAAPLVEGAIAAGVQASLGSDLETVYREAMGALDPKAEHLGEILPAPVTESATRSVEYPQGESVTLTLMNTYGLHARPAARLVQAIAAFTAEVTVADLTNGKGPVSARSLNRLATLGAVRGHQLCFEAVGPQASAALAAVQTLVGDNFGKEAFEAPEIPEALPAASRDGEGKRVDFEPIVPGMIQAIPVVDGFALAMSAHVKPPQPVVPSHQTANPEGDWRDFGLALEAVRRSIHERRSRIAAQMGDAKAEIFDAHLLILQDPELLAAVRLRIFEQKMNAAMAWERGIQEIVAAYEALEDAYLQRRAQDVVDVGSQVLLALLGQPEGEITFAQPVILLAQDLTPTQIACLDLNKVLGLATVQGGPMSHSTILARSLGIPALTGLPEALLDLAEGTLLALDGFAGRLWLSPGDDVRSEIATKRAAWLAQKGHLLETSGKLAVTLDGEVIEVAANVGSVAEAGIAFDNGADGIGVLRTEFLFLRRTTPPDEGTQFDALASIFARMGTRPVIVRTLDVGGDKLLPYIDLPPEANPYLGVRAIRLSQRYPHLLLAQSRAILRAGLHGSTKIMFPMITNLDEVYFGKAIVEQAHRELEDERMEHVWPVETGIMVETPAAALLAPVLAPHVDFFSIGTNDLTQYTLAAERGNPELAGFSDALHPAVLQLIRQVVLAARLHGKWVGVCGELAGDPVAIPVLMGLGVRELSMNPGSIPKAKDVIRSLRQYEAESLAERVLQADGAASARQIAKNFIDQIVG
jgi:multiphosphoryl transfer protein